MISALDETLMHQAAVPFAETINSDHRFFDRIWIAGHSRTGMHFLMGMAVYKNTNTFDGFFSIIKDGRQHNLRVSRPFLSRPDTMAAGPLAFDVVRPLEQFRITVAAEDGSRVAADLLFTATLPVSLEAPHFSRANGRIVQDYSRFEQLGRFNGWIEVEGDRVAVTDWFAARDHSWGVRPGMGGYDAPTALPVPGENLRDVGAGHSGFLVVALWFEVASIGGYLMLQENGRGDILYSHGIVVKREGETFREVETRAITHDLSFVDGTRACRNGRITITLTDGEEIAIDVESVGCLICYKGTGYDNGYADEQGLGVHRGDLVEADVYDVSHAEDVVLPDGRTIRPWHREGAAIVRIGDEEGMAHFPVISSGRIERYNLG